MHDPFTQTDSSKWFGSAAKSLRHSCEESDRLAKYGWIRHDGVSYGAQELIDSENNLKLTTEFIKKPGKNGMKTPYMYLFSILGGQWSAKITGDKLIGSKQAAVSLFTYFGTEEREYEFELLGKQHKKGINPAQLHIRGSTTQLGPFSIFIKEGKRVRRKSEGFRLILAELPLATQPESNENLHSFISLHFIDPDDTSPTYNKEIKAKTLPDLEKVHFAGMKVFHEDIWKVKDATLSMLKKHHTKARDPYFPTCSVGSRRDESERKIAGQDEE